MTPKAGRTVRLWIGGGGGGGGGGGVVVVGASGVSSMFSNVLEQSALRVLTQQCFGMPWNTWPGCQ